MLNHGILVEFAGFLGFVASVAQKAAYSLYSDTYKDVHGVRPLWLGVWDRTVAELEAATEDLYRTMETDWWKAEQAAEAAEMAEWEHEYRCDACYDGHTCREKMPTSGVGWAFQAAA
jgi:hypothetical protein